MRNRYEHLSAEKRACILQMRDQGQSLRRIALLLQRSPSMISHEVRRLPKVYDATLAGHQARQLRKGPRRQRKLAEHTAFLKLGWPPEQIAGTLERMWPRARMLVIAWYGYLAKLGILLILPWVIRKIRLSYPESRGDACEWRHVIAGMHPPNPEYAMRSWFARCHAKGASRIMRPVKASSGG